MKQLMKLPMQKNGIPLLGIGNRCYIKNAIIDKNVRIGDDVRINGGTHLENKDHRFIQ